MLKNMSEDERDIFLEDWIDGNIPRESLPGGNMARNLYEAKKLVPKPTSKPKRTTIDNAFSLSMDQGFVINIDGVVYGLNKYEDPDATSEATDNYGDPKQYVWAYTDMSKGDEVIETWYSDIDELINEIKSLKEEAPAPAKESTDDLMGAINSIKEDIKDTTEEIEKARAEAREKINKIREEIIDLKESKGKEGTIMDLEADIKEIEDILKDDLDGLKLDLDRHVKALKEEVKNSMSESIQAINRMKQTDLKDYAERLKAQMIIVRGRIKEN
jgi:gas vesicle protein